MEEKEYEVKKDGQLLKTYKSLPAAKQLAEKEMANVYSGEECIYRVVPETEEGEASENDEKDPEGAVPVKGAEDVPEGTADRYILTALMNVRKEPSMKAEIVRTLVAGTPVDVDSIADNWMYLTDGTFIFYDGGRYAIKSTDKDKDT